MTAALDVPVLRVRRAKHAVSAVFFASGFSFASWASRIPQVRHSLHLTPGALGLVLLALSAGSVVSLPLSGIVVARLGPARAILVMSLVLAVGLATVAVGQRSDVLPVVVGLVLVGYGNGTWDVAMNVEAAAVEQHVGRAIMPRFHAGYSLGTVAGALVGSVMVVLHVPVVAHLLAAALLVAVGVPAAVSGFLPREPRATGEHGERRHPMRAWGERRTLLVGVLVLAFAFTEGTGNDWLGVAVLDGYSAPAVAGPLAYAVFVAAMTTGRWFGPGLLDRHGRVVVLRGTALLSLAGLAVVVFGGSVALALAGAALWGVGASLGFPVGMSAAADDPRHAAARVSVVASIGYVAFLAGPPFVGFLGDHVGVLRALTATAGVLAVAALVAGASRPLATDGDTGAGA